MSPLIARQAALREAGAGRCAVAAWSAVEAIWLAPAAACVLLVWIAAAVAGGQNGLSTDALIIACIGDLGNASMLIGCMLLIAGFAIAAVRREPAPISFLKGRVIRHFASPWRVTATLGPIVLLSVLMRSFGTLKTIMPNYAPFQHDSLFAQIDRALFWGVEPWRITHFLLGNGVATIFLDRLYTLWIAIIPLVGLWFAFFAPRRERARYFLVTILMWSLLGVVGAYAGSSAGPIFLTLLGHPDAVQFEELINRLHGLDATLGERGLDAIHWSDRLWRAYSTGEIATGMGISAMPSLHNAISGLRICAAYRVGIWPGRIAVIFAALIFVGSVHLGWHYAIDGIVAMTAVFILWRIADAYLSASGYDKRVLEETETARSCWAANPSG